MIEPISKAKNSGADWGHFATLEDAQADCTKERHCGGVNLEGFGIASAYVVRSGHELHKTAPTLKKIVWKKDDSCQ